MSGKKAKAKRKAENKVTRLMYLSAWIQASEDERGETLDKPDQVLGWFEEDMNTLIEEWVKNSKEIKNGKDN